jgi:hypothetical protein
MTQTVRRIARVITGATLVALSIEAVRAGRFVSVLACVEIAAASAFCLPLVWRIAGFFLLAILGIAFLHHLLDGHFVASLWFAALVVVLEVTNERP